jgi:tetratricopeptide (TPR) repeat protein
MPSQRPKLLMCTVTDTSWNEMRKSFHLFAPLIIRTQAILLVSFMSGVFLRCSIPAASAEESESLEDAELAFCHNKPRIEIFTQINNYIHHSNAKSIDRLRLLRLVRACLHGLKRKDDLRSATATIGAIRKLFPDDGDFLVTHGNLAVRFGDLQLAKQYLLRPELVSDHDRYWANSIKQFVNAELSSSAFDKSSCLRACDTMVKLKVPFEESELLRSKILMRVNTQESDKQALRGLNNALKSAPRNQYLLRQRISLCQRLGKSSQQTQDKAEIAKLRKIDNFISTAKNALEANEKSKAKIQISLALKDDDFNTSQCESIAKCLRHLEDLSELPLADQLMERVLKVNPYDSQRLYAAADIKMSLSKNQDAIKLLLRAKKYHGYEFCDDGDWVHIAYGLTKAYLANKEPKRVSEAARAVTFVTCNPGADLAGLTFKRESLALESMGELETAIQRLTCALPVVSGEGRADVESKILVLRAGLYERTGRTALAMQDRERSKKIVEYLPFIYMLKEKDLKETRK